jgi:hypothetical protein
MPSGLHRTYGAHHLHFITTSCYRRLPFLRTARSCDTFLTILEQTRQRYRFVVVGYVVMGGFYKRGCQVKTRYPSQGGFVFLGIQPLPASPT